MKTNRKNKPINMIQTLKNRRQESFCQNLVNGAGVKIDSTGSISIAPPTATEAYIAAGYKSTTSAARRNASRLMTNADISARIAYLRKQQSQALSALGVATRLECCTVLTDIIRAKHTDFLSMGDDGVMMFDIGEDTLNTAALKKIKTRIQRDKNGGTLIERQFDEIELESKINAIKVLVDINGWNKKDETEEKAINTKEQFLDMLLSLKQDREPTPQTG